MGFSSLDESEVEKCFLGFIGFCWVGDVGLEIV